MEFSGKLKHQTILLISPEPWDHMFISKHHYAVHLAERNNQVYFLNPPGKRYEVQETAHENLWTVFYPGFRRGLRLLPGLLQRKNILDVFLKLERLCKNQFDIVWSFDNSVFFDFNALPDRVLSISHIVDLNQDFQFKKSTATAAVCFSNTQYILAKQRIYNQQSFFIHHGYNFKSIEPENYTFAGQGKIKVCYAGNLALKYMDWELIEGLIRNNPEIDFYFAGSGDHQEDFQRVLANRNVYYEGLLTGERLQAFYSTADVLLILYQYRKYKEQLANPHKMMDYLGSGKMVVATWTSEYEQLHKEELIRMYKDPIPFENGLKEVASNLKKWNSVELQQQRKQYAEANSYDQQLNNIEEHLAGLSRI